MLFWNEGANRTKSPLLVLLSLSLLGACAARPLQAANAESVARGLQYETVLVGESNADVVFELDGTTMVFSLDADAGHIGYAGDPMIWTERWRDAVLELQAKGFPSVDSFENLALQSVLATLVQTQVGYEWRSDERSARSLSGKQDGSGDVQCITPGESYWVEYTNRYGEVIRSFAETGGPNSRGRCGLGSTFVSFNQWTLDCLAHDECVAETGALGINPRDEDCGDEYRAALFDGLCFWCGCT